MKLSKKHEQVLSNRGLFFGFIKQHGFSPAKGLPDWLKREYRLKRRKASFKLNSKTLKRCGIATG